jgi:hypothetical protein
VDPATDSSSGESECRERFAARLAVARENLALLEDDDRLQDAQLREPNATFLAEYQRIAALTGPEFCEEANAAMARMATGNNAASERHNAEIGSWLRGPFESICESSERIAKLLDEFYSRPAPNRNEPPELSPKSKLFQEQATAFLANADRIRALTGDDFRREALAAIDAFTSLGELQAVKREAYAASAAPFLHGLRGRLRGRGRKSAT